MFKHLTSLSSSIFLLVLCQILFSASCIKAPKRVAVEANAPIYEPISSEATEDTSQAPRPTIIVDSGDPLAAIHNPKPTSCGGCHEAKRPALTHYAGNDCASCHNYPSFKGASFNHLPKPASCEGCHTRPVTVGLRAYPNAGTPAGFNPNDPAAIGSGHYKGKDCVSCHKTPIEGSPTFVFNHSNPKAEFCLPCHFREGAAEHTGDGNVILQANGNCFSCHKNFDVNMTRNWGTANGG